MQFVKKIHKYNLTHILNKFLHHYAPLFPKHCHCTGKCVARLKLM